ncbi:Histone deacetylase complex subunit SAP30 -like protein [Halotydeus destructor]|nr:Histone deacetylase complex subunit SAP30 -like protein [Halotydeus destructor]
MSQVGPGMNGAFSNSSLNLDEDSVPRIATFGGVGSAFSSTTTTTTGNSNNQLCCLTEETVRCSRVAGNASYSKRIQKTVQQKRLRLSIDSAARHIYICDHHKNMIQSVRTSSGKRKRKDSGDEDASNDGFPFASGGSGYFENSRDSTAGDVPQVDLGTLQVNTLRRYKKHYKLSARPGINKSQLVDNLQRHFRTIPVIEKEAITYFIYMVKTNKNKLDQVKGGSLNDV